MGRGGGGRVLAVYLLSPLHPLYPVPCFLPYIFFIYNAIYLVTENEQYTVRRCCTGCTVPVTDNYVTKQLVSDN